MYNILLYLQISIQLYLGIASMHARYLEFSVEKRLNYEDIDTLHFRKLRSFSNAVLELHKDGDKK